MKTPTVETRTDAITQARAHKADIDRIREELASLGAREAALGAEAEQIENKLRTEVDGGKRLALRDRQRAIREELEAARIIRADQQVGLETQLVGNGHELAGAVRTWAEDVALPAAQQELDRRNQDLAAATKLRDEAAAHRDFVRSTIQRAQTLQGESLDALNNAEWLGNYAQDMWPAVEHVVAQTAQLEGDK